MVGRRSARACVGRIRALGNGVRSRPRLWGVTAWVVLAAGIAGSAVAGWSWSRVEDSQNRVAASAVVANLTAALRAELQRASDLTAAARAELDQHGYPSYAQVRQWESALDASRRYPTSYAIAYVQRVPHDQLHRYIHTWAVTNHRTDSNFVVIPPGSRSHYCFLRVMSVMLPAWYRGPQLNIANAIPAGFDDCAMYPAMDAAARTGSFTTFSISGDVLRQAASLAPGLPHNIPVPQGSTLLGIVAPIGSDGDSPLSQVQGPDVSGFVLGVFDAGRILNSALAGQRGVSVELSRADDGTGRSVVATAGRAAAGPTHWQRTFATDGKWTADIAVSPNVPPVLVRLESAGIAVGGCALVFLLFGLLRTIGTRETALRLVENKSDELRHQALHDALTGLPNRALVLDRAEQVLRRARRDTIPAAALFIDLDGFKNINDTFGHDAGDRLLEAVAERLSDTLRDSDTVGRMGGDEFVILAEGASLAAGPELLAERILEVLREPFRLTNDGRQPYTVTASIGIACGDRTDACELIRDADIALYQAKAAGKNQYVVFEAAMHHAVRSRLETQMDLQIALDLRQFALVYQPTFDLRSMAVTGAEALLRWNHPDRGMVPPSAFVGLLEESGLIVDVGRWVLYTACEEAARWQQLGLDLAISVNVSARQLESDALVHDVEAALTGSGLRPHWLTLEITETALMSDAAAAARRLRALKRLGIGIAVDDFGTGYSSLAYLQQFPTDSLKIDRSFVSKLAHSDDTQALVRTLVQLGKNLGLSTVAEGIEEAHQLDVLRAAGCDSGQGYLFARPMPPAQLTALLLGRRCPTGSGRAVHDLA